LRPAAVFFGDRPDPGTGQWGPPRWLTRPPEGPSCWEIFLPRLASRLGRPPPAPPRPPGPRHPRPTDPPPPRRRGEIFFLRWTPGCCFCQPAGGNGPAITPADSKRRGNFKERRLVCTQLRSAAPEDCTAELGLAADLGPRVLVVGTGRFGDYSDFLLDYFDDLRFFRFRYLSNYHFGLARKTRRKKITDCPAYGS